jgi:hypothetical protein
VQIGHYQRVKGAHVDIRLNRNFRDNRKRKRLNAELGPAAVLALVDLWIWTAENRPDGNLAGMEAADIEAECNWTGEPGKLVETLCRLKLLDATSTGFAVHQWAEHQPWVSGFPQRQEAAQKALAARWHKTPKPPTNPGPERIPPECGPHTDRIRGVYGNTETVLPPSLPILTLPVIRGASGNTPREATPPTMEATWPTPETVLDYAQSVHCGYAGFDLTAAQYFLDYYRARGTPLADWQAALRCWKVRDGGKWQGTGKRARQNRDDKLAIGQKHHETTPFEIRDPTGKVTVIRP